MITLGILDWLRTSLTSGGISEGDPVKITIDSRNPKASEYDGRQAHIEEIIKNPDGQDGRLYYVEIVDSTDSLYLNRDQFERL